MIDLTKLEWGLRPFRELEALAVYGARTIFRDGNIEFLQDRQSCIGEEDARKTLCAWINHKALPALKEHIRKHDWIPMTQETFTLEMYSAKPFAQADINGLLKVGRIEQTFSTKKNEQFTQKRFV